jgi:hypothetical protein
MRAAIAPTTRINVELGSIGPTRIGHQWLVVGRTHHEDGGCRMRRNRVKA